MAPKGRGAPKPAEFNIVHLQAGRKQWRAGGSGPLQKIDGGFLGGGATKPRREVLLVGKALFGRQRLAFEVQEVDNSPAAVRKLLKKKKAMDDERFGSVGGFLGEEESDDEPVQARGPLDFMDVFQAQELAAKHSIQVKFEDIDRVERSGDEVTLSLSKPAQCYIKPEGEPRTVTMEVGKDITCKAKAITFTVAAPHERRGSSEGKQLSFSDIQLMLGNQSPRLAALFSGLPPPQPPAAPGGAVTPARKRKRQEGDDLGASSSTKKQPQARSSFVDSIAASSGSWLHKAVGRFGLKGCSDGSVSEEQWKAYFRERVLLEWSEAETLKEGTVAATWPSALGEAPQSPRCCYESYREPAEEMEKAAEVLQQIRSSVQATIASSALKLDPEGVARGVFLRAYHINYEDDLESEPRTVDATARLYAPNGTGKFIDLAYHNHKRHRMSGMTERFSHLVASRGGPSTPKSKPEKIFDLDFNECRRKNPTKTSLATNTALSSLGAHLFGAEGAMSNRKVFGLLVRAAGLGKFGESNGWPIAMARRRFKCGKEEAPTDTEAIAGDQDEEAEVGGCCVM